MSLENNISEVIQKQLKGDLIEKVVAEQLEKCVRNAVDSLFGSWGDCKKIVEEKIKEVMVPQLEKYDYSEHIVKLDEVLTQILNATSLDNKKIIESFKEFYLEEMPKVITISELLAKYRKHVEENVETDGLEIDYDDEPTYSSVEVTVEVEEDSRSWSNNKRATIYFECEHDESMNFSIHVLKSSSDENYFITDNIEVKSLRHASKFELFLMRMRQEYTHITVDVMSDSDDAYPEAKPECDWN